MSTTNKSALFLLVLTCLSLLLPASCQKQQTLFPELDTEQDISPQVTDDTTKTELVQSESEDKPVHLHLAVPFEDETAEALRLLFLAFDSGLLNKEDHQQIGQMVSLDDLKQFDAPFVLEIETVPAATGITAEQVRTWAAAANMPDVMYTGSAASIPGLSYLLPLNEFLFENERLSPDHLFTVSIKAASSGQVLYGIPYLASTPMICYNADLLSSIGASYPDFSQTFAKWADWMKDVQQKLSERGLCPDLEDLELIDDPDSRPLLFENAIFLYEQLSDFLPFIAPSGSWASGWGQWDGKGFNLDDPVFSSSAAWLREQALSTFSLYHLSESERQLVRNDLKGQAVHRVIGRVIDSADLSYWFALDAFRVCVSLMPFYYSEDLSEEDLKMRFPVYVRCLSVWRETRYPELAVRFSSFIAQDPDSLLMQSRFQIYDGLFPLIRDSTVWDAMVSRQPYGKDLRVFETFLPFAYTGGQQTVRSWDKIMDGAFRQEGDRYLSSSEDEQEAAFLKLKKTIQRIYQEGG